MALFSKIEGQLASGVCIRLSGTKSFIADVSIVPASALAFDHTISGSNRTRAQDKESLAIVQSRPPFSIMQNPKDVWVLRGRPGEREGFADVWGLFLQLAIRKSSSASPPPPPSPRPRQRNKRGRKPPGPPAYKQRRAFVHCSTLGPLRAAEGDMGGHHTSAPRNPSFPFFLCCEGVGQ